MLLNQLAAAKRQIADMEKQLPDFKPSLVPDSTDLREARILELAKKAGGWRSWGSGTGRKETNLLPCDTR